MPDRQRPDVEAAFFDELVTADGEFNPFSAAGWETLERAFLARVQPSPDAALLDVGCGCGHSRKIYGAHVGRYTGIDLSSVSVRLASAHDPEGEWGVADATALPFPAETFDIAAFSSVLHHIPNYQDALTEAVRVLRPGGRVFAFDPNVMHPAMAIFRHPSSPLYSPAGVSPQERPLAASALRRAFAGAGLVGVRVRGQSGIAYRDVAIGALRPLLRAYNTADRLLEWTRLARIFGTFLVSSGAKP